MAAEGAVVVLSRVRSSAVERRGVLLWDAGVCPTGGRTAKPVVALDLFIKTRRDEPKLYRGGEL